MRDELSVIYQQDIEHLFNALISDTGDVKSFLNVEVDGKVRFINVGLIAEYQKILWGRPAPTSYEATVDALCKVLFNNYVEFSDENKEELYYPAFISAAFTKTGNSIQGGVVRQCKVGDRLLGKPFTYHYVADNLTKYQQTMAMYYLLGHGEGGHAGQGMCDWRFYVNPSENKVIFEVDND